MLLNNLQCTGQPPQGTFPPKMLNSAKAEEHWSRPLLLTLRGAMFIAALFIIARTWKQPRYPSADKWIRKLWYIYTMKYYSAIKKNTFEVGG